MPSEKMASLGFPINEETASVMGCPKLPLLDALHADSVCGNSMHLSNSAIVLLCGLTCFGPRTEPAFVDWPWQAR